MRWKILAIAFLLLVAAYTAWPFYGLQRLASAVEARDVAALQQLVDFRALRLSLARQISATYLASTGKGAQLGSAAAGLGSAIADALIGELVTPEALADLLSKGSAGPFAPAGGAAPLTGSPLNNVWKTWLNSDYGLGSFSVRLPPDRPSIQQYQLDLRLSDWRWKLAGVQMPEELRLRLAQEWLKRERPQ
jgi:hypothetical protein